MNTASTIIKTNNLTKSYDGINRVDHISLEIKEGRIYGFLGPNGAGKSTTMKMLLSLVRSDDGEIEIFGKRLDKKTRGEILSQIGSLIEGPSFYGHLSAKENLEILEELLGLKQRTGLEKLALVGLLREKDKKVREYSLGMKQRLGIAMALLKDPKLLILDEPTNGLDPAGTQEMRTLLLKLAHEEGVTIMISTHLLDEIEKIADDVGILDKGRLIYQGPLTELEALASPRTILRTSDDQKALRLLRSLEPKFTEEGIVVENLSEAQRAELVSFLLKNKIDLYELSLKEDSLEELFLKITERF